MVDPSLIRAAFTPKRCDHPKVSMERVEVTEPGMVKGATDDEGRPIDGPTGSSGSGVALTVDGHRIFIPYA